MLNSKQTRTLKAIFEKPTRADIKWNDIESLFRALEGVITEGKGSRVLVALNDKRAVFHRPHPKRITSKGAVESARLFLSIAGVTP